MLVAHWLALRWLVRPTGNDDAQTSSPDELPQTWASAMPSEVFESVMDFIAYGLLPPEANRREKVDDRRIPSLLVVLHESAENDGSKVRPFPPSWPGRRCEGATIRSRCSTVTVTTRRDSALSTSRLRPVLYFLQPREKRVSLVRASPMIHPVLSMRNS